MQFRVCVKWEICLATLKLIQRILGRPFLFKIRTTKDEERETITVYSLTPEDACTLYDALSKDWDVYTEVRDEYITRMKIMSLKREPRKAYVFDENEDNGPFRNPDGSINFDSMIVSLAHVEADAQLDPSNPLLDIDQEFKDRPPLIRACINELIHEALRNENLDD